MASDRPAFDPDSATPLFEQAADYVAGLIASGELAPGQKLPAERDLADQWGIGYQTVRRNQSTARTLAVSQSYGCAVALLRFRFGS